MLSRRSGTAKPWPQAPRDPRARLLGHGARQRRHQFRAAVLLGVAHAHDPKLGIAKALDPGLDPGKRRGGLVGPVGDPLARAFVDHGDHFAHIYRVPNRSGH